MRRLLAPFALVAVSSLVFAVPAAGTGTDTGTDKVQQALDAFVARRGGAPGAIVVIQRGDEVEVLTAGVADLATEEAVNPDQHFRAASVAKAIRGAAVLALVDQGILSLDDTVAERVPKYAAEWGDVTLRQLLGHTSGVPDFIRNKPAQEAIQASPTVAPPPEELLDFVKDEPLNFEPGSEYEYSNSDNALVGLMAQQATSRSYDDILQTEVSDTLGLTNTSLPTTVDMPVPFARGYDVEDVPPVDVSEVLAPGWAWGSGGIVTTPADLNRFIRGYVGGELFGPRVQEEQRDVDTSGGSEPPGPGKNAAGLAIFRYRTKCGTVWGHTGNTVGYTQFAAASPGGQNSVTVSITRQIGEPGPALKALRALELEAVCAALADD
jgi:D-alanyl-D-alanine carboxypeptidase